jgi:large subunit ribosomal protein L21
MTYAIFEDSGTQIRAEVGQELVLDIRELPEDAKSVTFDRVLMVGSEKDPKIGTPYVDGAKVTADIVEREFKDKKIDVIKFKRRKGYRRKQGHRQRLMRVKVTDIKA